MELTSRQPALARARLTDWINLYWAPSRRNGGILVDYYYFYIWSLSATDYVNSPAVMALDHCPPLR